MPHCPKCYATVQEVDTICTNCGTSFPPLYCANCQCALDMRYNYCLSCETPFVTPRLLTIKGFYNNWNMQPTSPNQRTYQQSMNQYQRKRPPKNRKRLVAIIGLTLGLLLGLLIFTETQGTGLVGKWRSPNSDLLILNEDGSYSWTGRNRSDTGRYTLRSVSVGNLGEAEAIWFQTWTSSVVYYYSQAGDALTISRGINDKNEFDPQTRVDFTRTR